jgi:transmembrane sensor
MTSDDSCRMPDPLERDAHRWITELVSGEATTADAESLKQWCKQSPAHAAAFAVAARRWKDFGPPGHDLLRRGEVTLFPPPSGQVSRRLILGGAGALSAVAAGYAVVNPPLGMWPSLDELAADYRTVTGEQRHVAVASNVSVQMNTQTSITIPSHADDADRVKLIAGEASFTSSESSKPLMVLAGNGRTIANRARFDIRKIGPTVCVTCFDGDIRVERDVESATIGSRQQIRYDGRGLGQPVAIDPAVVSAWRDGILVFRFTPLADVIDEINRYRPGRVVLLNAALASGPVNGRFRVQRIEEVLTWIEQAFGVKSRFLPGGVVLLS